MSDTPRTDARVFDADLVSAVFARELERELAKANKNLESEIAGRLHFQWEIAELERENALLKHELELNTQDFDSYDIHGSDFRICKYCKSESGAGVLDKGIPHEPSCILYLPNV